MSIGCHRLQQVNVEQDNPFASALRAALRQDPDVILVGEIRDRETANIAIQAALTGHLVLSTLHANDSVSTISRLLDLDVDPVALAASLRGVLAQRLVKRLPVSSPNRPATRLERDWLLANRLHSYVDQQFGYPEEHVAYQGMLFMQAAMLTATYNIRMTPTLTIGGRYSLSPEVVAGNVASFVQLSNAMVSKYLQE